jgi:hypothetical protein
MFSSSTPFALRATLKFIRHERTKLLKYQHLTSSFFLFCFFMKTHEKMENEDNDGKKNVSLDETRRSDKAWKLFFWDTLKKEIG